VNHSRHSFRRLTAVLLTFRSGVAFTHECADPGRSNNPGQQNCQQKYRSCSCSGHVRKLYSRLYEMRKLVQELLPCPVSSRNVMDSGSQRAHLHESTRHSPILPFCLFLLGLQSWEHIAFGDFLCLFHHSAAIAWSRPNRSYAASFVSLRNVSRSLGRHPERMFLTTPYIDQVLRCLRICW